MIATSRRLPLRAWRALLDGMLATDPPTELAAQHIPTLVLWGEQDAVAIRAEQTALLPLLGAAATLRTYPDLGHAPHWERPEAVAGDLATFLGEG